MHCDLAPESGRDCLICVYMCRDCLIYAWRRVSRRRGMRHLSRRHLAVTVVYLDVTVLTGRDCRIEALRYLTVTVLYLVVTVLSGRDCLIESGRDWP